MQYHLKNPDKPGFVNGDRAGIRTLDPIIKSDVLYQLSYAVNIRLRHHMD